MNYIQPPPPPSLAVKIYEINRQSYLNCGIKKCKHSSRKIVAQKATRRNNSLSKSGFRTDIKPLGCHCPPGSSTRRTSPVTRHWKIRDTRPLFNKSRSLHIYQYWAVNGSLWEIREIKKVTKKCLQLRMSTATAGSRKTSAVFLCIC